MKSIHNTFKGVIDTTLRDGQQSPMLFDTKTYRFTREDKVMIVKGLIDLGVRNIEFFAPTVSKSEKSDFLYIKKYIRRLNSDVRLFAHCRCHLADVEQALTAGFDGLNLYIGIAEHSQKYSHGLSSQEIIRRVRSTIQTVRANYPDVYLRFSVEDCFRTPLKNVFEVYDEVADFMNTFGMPDTVGIATPEMVRSRVLALKKRYPKVDIECHFHNDRGYALINAISAVRAGASYIDTSIWGLAERSGITSVTGLLFNLYQEDSALCEPYNLAVCYPLNVLMGSILKTHVPYNEPVSATNRTHTAGVHQKAVLNNTIVYEAVDLGRFGVTKNELFLGPLSGWNLIMYYLKEFENYIVTQQQAKDIAGIFKTRTNEIGHSLSPRKLLINIVHEYGLNKSSIPREFLQKRVENMD